MDHPNVNRLIHAYDDESGEGGEGGADGTSKVHVRRKSGRLVVLRLARGPDLRSVLKVGGAPCLPLCRLISRHVVAAVGYLHSRAVAHRDVKPDNLVLDMGGGGGCGGAYDWEGNDAIWDDGVEAERLMLEEGWKVVLVDLGFARALTPDKMGWTNILPAHADEGGDNDEGDDGGSDTYESSPEKVEPQSRVCSFVSTLGEGSADTNNEQCGGFCTNDGRRRHHHHHRHYQMEQSVAARRLLRQMSALGTRAYAAPEMVRCTKKKNRKESDDDDKEDIGRALAEYVADYTILTDEYAVGRTLREVLTGVPATEEDTDGCVRRYRLASYLSGFTGTLAASPDGGGGGRKKHHHYRRRCRRLRLLSEVPEDATALICDLTRRRAEERITIWVAQLYPWICGGASVAGRDEHRDLERGTHPYMYDVPQGDVPSRPADPVVFLQCSCGQAMRLKKTMMKPILQKIHGCHEIRIV